MELRAWTDFAIAELGDMPRQAAPIREATIVAYDGGDEAIAIVGGKTVRIDVRSLYVRPRAPKKAPAVVSKPPSARSSSIAVESAFVRIKSTRADSPKEIYERIRDV